jgi:hypothetical protein
VRPFIDFLLKWLRIPAHDFRRASTKSDTKGSL